MAVAGWAGMVGLSLVLACIPVFSSTDQTTALTGGSTYNPHTSAALAQKSGSWLVIHDSYCHGFKSSPWQIRHTCHGEIAKPASFNRLAKASILQRLAGPGDAPLNDFTNRVTSSPP